MRHNNPRSESTSLQNVSLFITKSCNSALVYRVRVLSPPTRLVICVSFMFVMTVYLCVGHFTNHLLFILKKWQPFIHLTGSRPRPVISLSESFNTGYSFCHWNRRLSCHMWRTTWRTTWPIEIFITRKCVMVTHSKCYSFPSAMTGQSVKLSRSAFVLCPKVFPSGTNIWEIQSHEVQVYWIIQYIWWPTRQACDSCLGLW